MSSPLLQRLTQIRPEEQHPVLWAFCAHFLLFTGYTVLRPLREMIGIRGGVGDLPWLFTATFVTMLVAVPIFGWLVARVPRRRFIPIVYRFFSLNLLLFATSFALLPEAGVRWAGYAYFVWLSVFNLFAVSVFWSFMADVFRNAESKRLFGVLAAGASLGSICGSLLSLGLLQLLGTLPVGEERVELLLLVPILFFELAVRAMHGVGRWLDDQRAHGGDPQRAAEIAAADSEILREGGIWSGLIHVARSPYLAGICVYMLLATAIGTQVYFHQAAIVSAAGLDDLERTQMFSHINLATNTITLVVQGLLVGRLMQRFGVSATLVALPCFYVVGFAFFGANPVLWALIVFEVARRAANYALAKPAKEVLFTVVSRDAKYKSKSFIDTVVYRGGDAVGGWGFEALTAQRSLGAAAWSMIPLCVLWAGVAWALGRRQRTLAAAGADHPPPRAVVEA